MKQYVKRKNKRKIVKILAAYIVLIFAMIFAVLPIFWVFSTSLNDTNTLLSTSVRLLPEKITLRHYAKVLTGADSQFIIWLGNSLIVALSTVILSLVVGITAAYSYSRYRFKGRKLILNSFLLLNAFPNILSIVAYFKLLSLLKLAGSLFGLVLVYTGGQLIFTIWNLKGYFDTLPYEIEEAALIDGASPFKVLYKIVLPLAKPAIAVTAMFSFMAGWNEYVIAATFMTTRKMFTLPVGLYSLQNVGNYAQDWPLFAAGSLIVAVPVMIVFLILQRSLISGLTLGSTK